MQEDSDRKVCATSGNPVSGTAATTSAITASAAAVSAVTAELSKADRPAQAVLAALKDEKIFSHPSVRKVESYGKSGTEKGCSRTSRIRAS